MFSQAWREIDEEKQSEVVRQALASLQSDERFLVIEALCTANGTAFPQVSRRTTSQLIPDIVAALPRMADSAVQLLMERRYQGAMGVAGDFSFDFAADDPFCKQSEPALRRALLQHTRGRPCQLLQMPLLRSSEVVEACH